MATTSRIRESCDQCSQQKIKCGKQRPRCARCVTKGVMACNYSVSMRIGRPPRPKTGEAAVSEQSRTSIEPSEAPSSPCRDGALEFIEPQASDLGMTTCLHRGGTPAPVVPAMTAHEYAAPTSQCQAVPLAPSTDCLSSMVQMLDELHIRDPLCSGGATDIDSVASRTVNMVLVHNREAVDMLNKVLSCSCVTQPSVLVASYLLLSAVVSWYGAVVDVRSSPPCHATSTSTACSIAPSPLYMGSYQLNPEAQRGIRAKIVLKELDTHLKPLLLRLPNFYIIPRDCTGIGVDEITSTSEPRIPHTPLDVQKCMLREQLRQLVAAARQDT